MIITIDGLDGAGKSTLARKLSDALSYEYVDKPIYELFHVKGDSNPLYKEICQIQKAVYDETNSNILKSYFTGLSLLYVKECMSDRNIIIDRGLLSAYAFNGDKDSEPVFEALLGLGVFFDLSIFLIASRETRIERMKKRNENDPDLKVDKIKSLTNDSVLDFIDNHPQLPCVFISTDSENEDEVFEEAMKIIKERTYTKKRTINEN